MEIIISEKSFLDIKRISSVKTYISKLDDYIVDSGELKSNLILDISIFDIDNNDIFITKKIPLTIILSDKRAVSSLEIKSINLEVIESWGINAYYELILKLEEPALENTREEKETIVIDNNIDESEDIIIEEDNTIEEDNITYEEASNVEIITTKSNLDENSFLGFFDRFLDGTFKIKTFRITDESELNALSIEYNKTIEELYKGYDKDLGIVMINLND
ncbi:MAG: hypothetical protein ACI35W_02860 [Anaeroplasmataceae bacterium]